jgi:murein DD-endopeptidase MepM/ murein hydrolase activator NlpD
MVLAMVKAPGDAALDDAAGARALGAEEAPGELAPLALRMRAAARDRRLGRDGAGDDDAGGARATHPIDGPHTYGDGFGDRPNHRGQDLLADCGTPLRATSDGKVRLVDEDGSAGRYVVLSTAAGRDLVYMHLSDVDLSGGERVRAGERVGSVGRTGNASTCHLHFETWSSPGWYAGGEPRDPLAMLRSRERSRIEQAP